MNNLEIIKSFPKDFLFGVATSSYQIEGSGFGSCGESHWDAFSKKNGMIFQNQNGSKACEHFFRWKQDLELIKDAGFSAYRFSFSWPRILPSGKKIINNEGVEFYDRLIDHILELDIKTFATLYHWDLPNSLAENGGWQNRDTAEYFGDYSELIIKRFGDRLFSIATINEPWCVSWLSHYIGEHAPGIKDKDAAVKSMHNILLAHGKSLSRMRDYNHKNLGIVLNKNYCQPYNNSDESIEATSICDEIYNLWFDEALFNGKYPKKTLNIFEKYMPKEFEDDLLEISKPIDWIGINYYTRSLVDYDKNDKFVKFKQKRGNLEVTDMGWEIFPEGLEFLLNRLKSHYSKNIPIHITENGMARNDKLENGSINDFERISFFDNHLKVLLKLISEGMPLKSYFAWSLLDNFEWAYGYAKRFGIVYVDYSSQKRTPKSSYKEFKRNLSNK